MGSDRSHPTRVLRRATLAPSDRGAPEASPQAIQLPLTRRVRRAARMTSLPPFEPSRRPLATRDFGEPRVGTGTGITAGGARRAVELGELGPAASYAGWDLVCDLPSPLVVGAEPWYRLGAPAGAGASGAGGCTYRWAVRERADGSPVWRTSTDKPELRIAAAAPGRYLLEVSVLAGGTPTGVRLSLDHDVEVEPAPLTAVLARSNASVASAMRELVTELRPYIIAAAAATGPTGITARYLAAVLFMELLGRPRAVRERELDEVGALLAALERGEPAAFTSAALDRPLGVGQLRPTTAAMAAGVTPWIEQDRDDRRPAREQIYAGYDALPLETKRALFTRLRWPKSNIALAARLLAALKNRPHRFRGSTRAELAADPEALAIVATEYVLGATSTPAAEARPSGYARRVWRQMQEPLLRTYFPED